MAEHKNLHNCMLCNQQDHVGTPRDAEDPHRAHFCGPGAVSHVSKFVNHNYHVKVHAILVSIVVSIPACHAGDQGSIP